MTTLYSLSYLVIIISTLAWFFQKSRKQPTKIPKITFLASVGFFVLLFILRDGTLFQKLVIFLPREVGIFCIAVLLGHYYAEKVVKYLLVAAGLLISTQMIHFETFRPHLFSKDIQLDPKGELLFDIKDHDQLNKIKKDLAFYKLKIRRAFPNLGHKDYSNLDEYYIIDIPDDRTDDLKEIMEKLLETEAVDYVERNEVIKLEPLKKADRDSEKMPDYGINDLNLSELWGFKPMKIGDYYKLFIEKKINVNNTAKIAILDTGVNGDHEDLKDNFFSIDSKYDKDTLGHGTHCAGIAGAVTNNKIGIASFSYGKNIQITSIKVLNDDGSGTQESIIEGIILAADRGMDVISLSLGGYSSDERQQAYEEAVQYANKAGAIVIVAAGNDDESATQFAPANVKGVITVTAVDQSLDKADFSNYVNDIDMGIAAPGVDILSTFPDNKYQALSGTSMAVPYVAGLVGVMKSIKPDLDTEDVFKILEKTGIDTGSTKQTGKFIQPYEVLMALQ
ncbi:S8 family serine peptidase [bacterium]|nr:S8 family serine peptidase [bacterium]